MMIRTESLYKLRMGGLITLFLLLFLVSLNVDDDYSTLWDRWNIQLTLVISPFDPGGLFNLEAVSFFHVSLCRLFCQLNFYGFYRLAHL